jgi:hypothetical protein
MRDQIALTSQKNAPNPGDAVPKFGASTIRYQSVLKKLWIRGVALKFKTQPYPIGT